MKVFMITSVPLVPPWDQGDKNLAYTLTRAMRDVQFQVLTTPNAPAFIGENLESLPVYKSNVPPPIQKAFIYAWLLLHRSWTAHESELDQRLQEKSDHQKSPDLYHLIYRPTPLSSWMFNYLPEFKRRPTIHTVPATYGDEFPGRCLFFADRVVTLSEFGQQKLLNAGVKSVVHIPAGIHLARWVKLTGQTDSLKVPLGLSGHPVVLFPGHYGPGQGADIMLKALSCIVCQIPDVRVIFACRLRSSADQEKERKIKTAIDLMGLTSNVRFYNTVVDMSTLIGASEVVVLPLENMRDKVDIPTTLLESLAAHKPVVISDIPPMNELIHRYPRSIRRDEIGFAVPPGDATALAHAILTILENRELRESMGQCGQDLIRERFDIEQVARQYETLYQEMLQCTVKKHSPTSASSPGARAKD